MKQKLIRHLQDAFDSFSAIHGSDFFADVDVAAQVECLQIEAARFGVPIGPECHTMTARDALVVVGRLLDHLTPKPDCSRSKRPGRVGRFGTDGVRSV